MKVGLAIAQAAESERDLVGALAMMRERHVADQDVWHLTHQFAAWGRTHLEMLEPMARRYGADLGAPPDAEPGGFGNLLATVQETGSRLLGRRPEGGLVLLRDLRKLYLMTSAASINYVILAQGAQAVKDRDLLDVVTRCEDDTLRTLRWMVFRIKEAAPQAIAV
jgi:hypothetical protein